MNIKFLCRLRSSSTSLVWTDPPASVECVSVCFHADGFCAGINVSCAVKFGDFDIGRKFGEAGAANGVKFGDIDVVAVGRAKFGDVDTGGKFGDIGTVVGIKLGEADIVGRIVGVKFGEVAVVVMTASISGDTDFVGIRGRKLGDMTNESARLGATRHVANKAETSSDVDVDVGVGLSCVDTLGHTAYAPSST